MILFLATALLCGACLGAVFAQTGGTTELKGVSLRDSYFLGETLSVEGASIVSNGKEEQAEAVLYMPGGKAVRGIRSASGHGLHAGGELWLGRGRPFRLRRGDRPA